MPSHARRSDTVLDAARSTLATLETEEAGALAALAEVLRSEVCDRCMLEIEGDGDTPNVYAAGDDELRADKELAEIRQRVRATRASERGEVAAGGSYAVTPIYDGDERIGILAATTSRGRTLSDEDVVILDGVGQLLGSALGRVRAQRRTRDAVRRAQRIASQLHQLISTSITVAGERTERSLLETLAVRVRSVFDGDEAVVALESGPAAPLHVVASGRAQRARVLTSAEVALLDVPAGDGDPRRVGDWMVCPILQRRGASRGTIAVRRQGAAFSDDDAEVITLLAQMAASALEATELNDSILRSEERLRVLVEAAPIGIVETDLAGGIEWWNTAARTLFEWPGVGEELADTRPTFPEVVRIPLEELWRSAAAGSVVIGNDLAGIEIGGSRRDLAVSVALLPATPGRTGSLLTLVEDVTDHRQLMEELRHAQRMEVIGQLSSSVAHDFNNLLTLIAGYAELLTLESVDRERTWQLAHDIQATTTRASTLTGKLLTMGRTKSPTPVVFSPVGAVSSIAEVLDRILGSDVALELDLGTAVAGVRADQDQFEQMVMNLATNARDAMPAGGVLRIVIEPTALDASSASRAGLEPGDYVHIAVIDTGDGMDEDTRLHCFEPLFTTKGPSKGTGLGLPAARRVVVESGGSIEVHSAPGDGTTFDILFPSAGVVVAPQVEPEIVVTTAESATILLAEDEDGIRQMVERVLARNGYDVLEASSAERALELSRTTDRPIDILVSDVVMAEMSGVELAVALQAERPGLLVVLVSGNVEASVLEDLEPGTAAFVAKPFRPSELIGVLAELRKGR